MIFTWWEKYRRQVSIDVLITELREQYKATHDGELPSDSQMHIMLDTALAFDPDKTPLEIALQMQAERCNGTAQEES